VNSKRTFSPNGMKAACQDAAGCLWSADLLLQAERRILVAHEVDVGVDAVPPAQNTDQEVENASRDLLGEQDCEERDHPDHE